MILLKIRFLYSYMSFQMSYLRYCSNFDSHWNIITRIVIRSITPISVNADRELKKNKQAYKNDEGE